MAYLAGQGKMPWWARQAARGERPLSSSSAATRAPERQHLVHDRRVGDLRGPRDAPELDAAQPEAHAAMARQRDEDGAFAGEQLRARSTQRRPRRADAERVGGAKGESPHVEAPDAARIHDGGHRVAAEIDD